jgi:hypothetical protein
MKIMMIAALAAITALCACSAADQADTFNYGQQGRVTCYASGVPYFDDFSTGKVEHHDGGASYFVSASTNRLTEVYGNCVVDFGATPQPGFKPIR